MTRFVFLALLAAPTALAQEAEPDEANVIYAAETLVDFTEVSVNGEVVKPPLKWIAAEKRGDFKSLVQLRVHWNEEMAASVHEVN